MTCRIAFGNPPNWNPYLPFCPKEMHPERVIFFVNNCEVGMATIFNHIWTFNYASNPWCSQVERLILHPPDPNQFQTLVALHTFPQHLRCTLSTWSWGSSTMDGDCRDKITHSVRQPECVHYSCQSLNQLRIERKLATRCEHTCDASWLATIMSTKIGTRGGLFKFAIFFFF